MSFQCFSGKSTKVVQKIGQKLRKFIQILSNLAHRLNRWITNYNRPINRPSFDRLIGRLIGIGRTLKLTKFRAQKWQKGSFTTSRLSKLNSRKI